MSITPSTYFDYLDTIAVVAGGLFSGSSFYVTVGEVPALNEFGINERWRFFPYMFKRPAILQPILIVVTGTSAILHGTRIIGDKSIRNLWFASGAAFLGIIPYTILFLVPLNKIIIDDNNNAKLGSQTKVDISKRKSLLDKWAMLHSVRTVGSIIAFGAMVYGLSRHSSLLLTWQKLRF